MSENLPEDATFLGVPLVEQAAKLRPMKVAWLIQVCWEISTQEGPEPFPGDRREHAEWVEKELDRCRRLAQDAIATVANALMGTTGSG